MFSPEAPQFRFRSFRSIDIASHTLAALTNKKLRRLILFNFVDRFFWTATSDGPLACVASAGSKDGRDAWQEQGNIGIFVISLNGYA